MRQAKSFVFDYCIFLGMKKQRYKDSNLENDGVRVRCLTVWL